MTGTTTHCIVHGTVENWFSCDRLGLLQKEGNAMSTETNKALVRRWVEEVLNTKGNLAVIDELFAPDYADYTNPPDWPPGREGHKQIVALYHAAFPDFHYTIEHEVAEGDWIVVRGTYHLTHTGEFFGIAPTGKHVTTTGMHLFRVADQKIVEHWCNNDDLGVMRQLGVVS
jgi:predicted ester cyclase